MSCHEYINYGYGVIVSDLDKSKITVESIQALLDFAPLFKQEVEEYFKECGIKPTIEDYLDYDQETRNEIAYILQEVIKEAEDIDLYSDNDLDGKRYLMYLPVYPWYMNKTDLSLNPTKLNEVFNKYITLVSNGQVLVPDYVECHNGG